MRYTAALAHYAQLLHDVDAYATQFEPDLPASNIPKERMRVPLRFVARPRCDRMAKSRNAARQRRLHHFVVCLRDAHERSRQLELDLGERLLERFTSDARDAATREDEWP